MCEFDLVCDTQQAALEAQTISGMSAVPFNRNFAKIVHVASATQTAGTSGS